METERQLSKNRMGDPVKHGQNPVDPSNCSIGRPSYPTGNDAIDAAVRVAVMYRARAASTVLMGLIAELMHETVVHGRPLPETLDRLKHALVEVKKAHDDAK